MAHAQPKTPAEFERLWRSWSSYHPYGLASDQKHWKNLRSGKLWKKLLCQKTTGR